MEWVTVPILAHQNMGAMMVFVLFGLWMGRSHLRAVGRKAFRGDASVQDADEMMSYRTAVFLVLGGSGFMMWWLWMSGLALWATGMVLFIAFVLFLGLTRMVTEGGFFTTRAPMNPGNFMVSGFGVETLGASGVPALGYTFVWAGELRVFVMAACANALMMAEKIRGRRKILLWAMLVAILVSALGSIWVQMELGYRYGGINLSGFFTGLVHYPFRFIVRNLANPTGPHWGGWCVDGVRRRLDGGADAGPAALVVVAHPPDESADQFNVDDGLHYAERLSILVDQRSYLEVRGTATLRPRQAIFYRLGHRPVCLHGVLADYRLFYWYDR